MYRHCHGCGEELSSRTGESSFCPHCGAPQIFLLEHDRPVTAEGETTGAVPPPRPRAIEWKTAMVCSVVVAGMAALLSIVAAGFPAVTLLNWLWIMSGSVTTLALYQRRRPLAKMNAGIGARIGLVTGVSLVGFVAVAMAGAGLVARFGLHTMAGFDAKLSEQMHLQMEHAMLTNPVPKEMLPFFYSPEFSAGMMLVGMAMVAGLVVVLSAVSGAAGGMLRMRQGRAA